MGLDMYLNKRTYMSTYGDRPTNIEIRGDGLEHIKPERVEEIVERVGYWRKANAIHAWFVTNVQGGEDECEPHEVSREQLQELLDTVNKVLADHSLAAELLPTQGGFFFGDTSYGEDYFQDLEDTKNILEPLLAEDAPKDPEPQPEITPEVQEITEGLTGALGGTVTVVSIDPKKSNWYKVVSYEYRSSW